MLALTIPPPSFCIPQKPAACLNIPLLCPRKREKIGRRVAISRCFLRERRDFGGGISVRKGGFAENSWCCWCRRRWESEGEGALEAEILEFMEKSGNPSAFPSRTELVEAGRMDLVEAIKSSNGWLSMGWDSEEEEVAESDDDVLKVEFGVDDFRKRVESFTENASSVESFTEDASSEGSNQPASSSGRSLENDFEEESGIDGILSRLEKERNSSLGINVGIPSRREHPSRKEPGNHRRPANSKDVDRENKFSSRDGNCSHHYTKPDTWRSWSLNRAGFKDMEFEAAEISYGDYDKQDNGESSIHEGDETAPEVNKTLNKWNTASSGPIETRLQHLQLELSSVLSSLKSGSEETNSKKVPSNSPIDLHSLSDALEFQQNEFASSHDRLRTLRAKLAVLEGKMSLALVDARKRLEEKQMRIDSACRSLELLHTTCIVWPSSASEVLLTGSFDGWTTQRKMKKSRTGIFSLNLKLYPGRYEIKFIVDGKWKVDPLRPVVFNNGYDNNLLIIPEKSE